MSKPKLILLHGALGSKQQLTNLGNALSDRYHILSLNFEGHGGRKTDKPYSIELFAQNLLRFMEENSIEKSDFFGYSMGGYVALKLAQNHPEKVNRIFTLATKFNWTAETAVQETKMLNPEKIEEKVPHFAAALKERHAPLDWKEVMAKTASMMLALGKQPALSTNNFEALNHQVLIGIGDADQMVSIAESKTIADALPNGQLHIFEGFQHPIEKVDIPKLTQIIKDFFV